MGTNWYLRSSHSDSTIIADAVEPRKKRAKIKEHVLLNEEHVLLKCYVPGDPLVGWDQLLLVTSTIE